MPILGSVGAVSTTAAGALGTKPLPGVPVASNCWYNGGPSAGIPTTGGTTATTSRSKHRATTDCADLVLCYGNIVTAPQPETDGPNTYTVRAAVEWNGIILPVTFRGQRSGTCDPGGLLMSDPLPVEFFAGTDFWVRTHVSAGGTNIVSANRVTYSAAGEGATAGSDLTAPGSAAISDSTGYLYAPSAILGTPADPSVPTVGIIGDSIAAGTGDGAAISELGASGALSGGFIVRALNRNYGYVNVAQGSETMAQYLGHHRRAALLNTCKYWIVQYGHNDLAATRTAAQVEADLIITARHGKTRGAKVWLTTQTPASSSTNSFVDTANQTTSSINAELQPLNAWLRDGCPISSTTLAPVATGTSSGVMRVGAAGHPVVGVFDTGAAVESAAASGKWAVNGSAGYATADGTHPSAAGHALMAAALNTALLT